MVDTPLKAAPNKSLVPTRAFRDHGLHPGFWGPRWGVKRVVAKALTLAFLALASGACGGKTPEAKAPTESVPIDADPIALLPSAALGAGFVDVGAVYRSGSIGGQAALLTEQMIPFLKEAGVVPSRDVDTATLGLYATQGIDALVVLRGRFNGAQLDQAARSGTLVRSGVPVVVSTYGQWPVYTYRNVGFTLLSERTLFVGSEGVLRRALDRVRDGRVQRDLPPWAVQTLEAKGAAFSFTLDMGAAPTAQPLTATLPVPWLQGLRALRWTGNFQPGGVNVVGSLTYADPSQAMAGAQGLRSAVQWAQVLSAAGAAPRLTNVQINPAQTDVGVQFVADESSLATFLARIPGLLPR